jgi:hypothetical protein
LITATASLRTAAAALIALLIVGTAAGQHLGEAALLIHALTGLLVIAIAAAIWLGFEAAPLWLGLACGALGLLLAGLAPGVPGSIGVCFAMALAAWKRRQGLALAIALEAAYAALGVTYGSQRFLPAALNAIGLAAVYLATAVLLRARRGGAVAGAREDGATGGAD